MKRKGYTLNKIKSYRTYTKPARIWQGGEIERVYTRKFVNPDRLGTESRLPNAFRR